MLFRSKSEIHHYLFHQATLKMLELLRQAMEVPPEQFPVRLADVGNTVSCTLPVLIDQLRTSGELNAARWNALVGFGVGWSWAGCLWKDILGGRCAKGVEV